MGYIIFIIVGSFITIIYALLRSASKTSGLEEAIKEDMKGVDKNALS